MKFFLAVFLGVVVAGGATLAATLAAPLPTARQRAQLRPRAAATISPVPMFKPASVPASAPKPKLSYMLAFDFFHCTNQPGCVFYDVELVEVIQRAGKGIRFKFTDRLPAAPESWVVMADWSAWIADQPVFVQFWHDIGQRAQQRFFIVEEYDPPAGFRPASAGQIVWKNPVLNVLTWGADGKLK